MEALKIMKELSADGYSSIKSANAVLALRGFWEWIDIFSPLWIISRHKNLKQANNKHDVLYQINISSYYLIFTFLFFPFLSFFYPVCLVNKTYIMSNWQWLHSMLHQLIWLYCDLLKFNESQKTLLMFWKQLIFDWFNSL